MSELIGRINWIDVFAVFLLIRTSYIGARMGLSTELFKLIGILAGLYFGMRFYSDLGSLIISKITLPPELSDSLSFLILIFASIISLKYVGIVLSKIVKLTFAEKIDQWGGFIFGLARGCIIVSLIIMFFGILGIDYFTNSFGERSLTGPYFQRVAPVVYQGITKILPETLDTESPLDEGDLPREDEKK